MQVQRTSNSLSCAGSVRIDLLGGTVDLYPICHFFKKTFTLNMATSLKAHVKIERNNQGQINLFSKNYNSKETYSLDFWKGFYKSNLFDPDSYGSMTFVLLLIAHFKEELEGLNIELASDAPAGSGLGGSSSLGVTLFKGLSEFFKKSYTNEKIIKIVQSYESMILNQGVPGYQDYYPALTGGILALESQVDSVLVHQLFSHDLKKYLEQELTLVYSNQSRNSGINNWEVFQNFFKKDKQTIQGLAKITDLSEQAFLAIQERNYKKLSSLILEEGRVRRNLFPGILSPEMASLDDELRSRGGGIKVCGAGGGGCFLVLGVPTSELAVFLKPHGFKVLPFSIEENYG